MDRSDGVTLSAVSMKGTVPAPHLYPFPHCWWHPFLHHAPPPLLLPPTLFLFPRLFVIVLFRCRIKEEIEACMVAAQGKNAEGFRAPKDGVLRSFPYDRLYVDPKDPLVSVCKLGDEDAPLPDAFYLLRVYLGCIEHVFQRELPSGRPPCPTPNCPAKVASRGWRTRRVIGMERGPRLLALLPNQPTRAGSAGMSKKHGQPSMGAIVGCVAKKLPVHWRSRLGRKALITISLDRGSRKSCGVIASINVRHVKNT